MFNIFQGEVDNQFFKIVIHKIFLYVSMILKMKLKLEQIFLLVV